MMSTGMTVSISSAPLARITNALFAAMVGLHSAKTRQVQLRKSAETEEIFTLRL